MALPLSGHTGHVSGGSKVGGATRERSRTLNRRERENAPLPSLWPAAFLTVLCKGRGLSAGVRGHEPSASGLEASGGTLGLAVSSRAALARDRKSVV